MRTSLSLSCLAAGLLSLCVGSEALAAGSGFTSRVGRFQVTGGSLEAAARALAGAELPAVSSLHFDAGRVVTLPGGERVVKLRQQHQGLPVVDRGVTVTFGKDGAGRLITASLEEELPSSIVPAISAADAVKIAGGRTGLSADPERSVLAIWPTPDGARLVWGVESAPLLGLPYLPVVVVDAQSGEIIYHYNAVESLNAASVFPSNPVKSPSVMPVVLPVGAGKVTLENDLVKSLSCIDKHSLVSIPGLPIMIHSCDLLQIAAPDANGDFLTPPADDKDPEDTFAEISMFHHVNRAYDYFRAFDAKLDVNAGKPVLTVSNLRIPDGLQTQDPAKLSNPNLPLVPFQNAFFAPENPLFSAVFGIDGAAMWFGQGPLKDYSYDGDVIYHEFGHAVVNVTLKLVGTSHMDELGASASPGAMNEGLADYFSSALTGDGDVGEYASQDFSPGSKAIRSLTNPDACPAFVGGEVHQDATMFSGSLWDVRKALNPEQQALFDGAVFSAMNSSSTGNLGFEDFAKLLLAAVEASPLGKPVADTLTAAFTARGLLPRCERILEFKGETLNGPEDLQGLWFAPGTQTNGVKLSTGATPGVVQFHGELPAKTTKLTVGFSQISIGGGGLGMGGTPFKPKLLVRFGDEPIQFTYKPLKTAEGVLEVEPSKGSGGLGMPFVAEVEVPADAGSVYVMIASAGQLDGAYTAFSLTTEQAIETGAGGAGGSTGSTTATGATTGAGGSGGGSQEIGGCGCALPASDGDGRAGLAAIAALGLFAARRRRSR